MNLLEKFQTVEVRADNRISETDKWFCERHQTAYEAAIQAFKELSFFWADMQQAQTDALGPEKSGSFYHDYLSSREGPNLSEQSIKAHIGHLHTDFIVTLVRYFNSAYHVTVSSSEVCEALLPQKPDRYERSVEVLERYERELMELTIRYQDAVDQIILRLDGRSFAEQAFHELYESCHEAAWNRYDKTPNFEQKKDTIRFTGYYCKHECWLHDSWELDSKMKSILRGVAHFETGSHTILPLGFGELVSYYRGESDFMEFSTCEKVKQIKMFKNGRVDLKFNSAEFAGEFIGKYLGAAF